VVFRSAHTGTVQVVLKCTFAGQLPRTIVLEQGIPWSEYQTTDDKLVFSIDSNIVKSSMVTPQYALAQTDLSLRDVRRDGVVVNLASETQKQEHILMTAVSLV